MKIGSLFDGSGGFPLAGSLCGMTPAWAAEVEPYPIAVTKSRFLGMKHLGSVTDVRGSEIEPVDVITFGSPCQDLSIAGKRAGLKHEDNGDEETTRSGLFMEAVRIIKEMRDATNGVYPRIALWENVPGAFSSNKKEDFRVVLQELIRIVEPQAPPVPAPDKNGWPYADCYVGDGWSLAYRVLDAQFWGVPQRRRRVYLVLHLTGQCAGDILFERMGLRGYFAESQTPWQTAPGNPARSSGATDSEGQCLAFSFDSLTSNSMKSSNPHSGCRQVEVAKTLDCFDPSPAKNQGGIAVLQPVPCLLKTRSGCEGGGKGWAEEVCYTLNTTDRPDVVYCMAHGQANAEIMVDRSPCLNCNHEQPIVVKPQDVQYIVRRLTPTECARLQGFPDCWGHPDCKDDFTDEEYQFWLTVRNTHAEINSKTVKEYTKAQMVKWYNGLHTDSAEYKMWGNGIALPTALYVMQGIADALAKYD